MSVTSVDTARSISTSVTDFLDDLVGPDALGEPAFGPLGRIVFDRTYSRDIYLRATDGGFEMNEHGEMTLQSWWTWSAPTDGRTKETWADTCRRIAIGSVSLDSTLSIAAARAETVELFEALFCFKFTPAGRHLWVTGTPSVFTRNCWSAGFGPRTSDHFRFGASRLFEGGGVGSNYSADQMAVTSPMLGTVDITFRCDIDHKDFSLVVAGAGSTHTEHDLGRSNITVHDSREGWVDAWCQIIDLAGTPGEHAITVDVNQIRPYGAPLRTFGGTASGPAPFVTSTIAMVNVLNTAAAGQRKMTGLEAMEIDHQIAAAVVAGGTRRSARMSLMSWDSPEIFEFIDCKADHSAHWSTNISVEIDQNFHDALAAGDMHASEVLAATLKGMATNGEPGIVDTGVINATRDQSRGNPIRHVNPCAEATLETTPGDANSFASGESCNLGSVNLDYFGTDYLGAKRAFELAGRFLYRSTFKPYGDPTAALIEERNRRIGVGFYGFQGWCIAHGTKMSDFPSNGVLMEALAMFRISAYEAACTVADAHGTPRPISATAIAPTGSIAQLSGATSGINPVYSPYFIRRVRFGSTDEGWTKAQDAGYVVEKDVYADNTMTVEYPTRDSILERYDESLVEGSFDISFEKYMAVVAAVQKTFCGSDVGQAVSHTAQLRAGTDPHQMMVALLPLLGTLKGVTAFPEVSRPQSPLEAISREEFIEYTQFREAVTGDSNDGQCSTGACPTR